MSERPQIEQIKGEYGFPSKDPNVEDLCDYALDLERKLRESAGEVLRLQSAIGDHTIRTRKIVETLQADNARLRQSIEGHKNTISATAQRGAEHWEEILRLRQELAEAKAREDAAFEEGVLLERHLTAIKPSDPDETEFGVFEQRPFVIACRRAIRALKRHGEKTCS